METLEDEVLKAGFAYPAVYSEQLGLFDSPGSRSYRPWRGQSWVRRTAAGLLGLFGIGCGDGVTPPPIDGGENLNPYVTECRATPLSGPAPHKVQVWVAGQDPDGSISEWEMNMGNGSVVTSSTQLNGKEFVYKNPGKYSISCRVVDNEGAASSPMNANSPVHALVPVPNLHNVVMHLRNLSQDEEPFVRGQGNIEFHLGQNVSVSPDSVVFQVEENLYEVQANHRDFYEPWLIVKERGQGRCELLGQGDLRGVAEILVDRDLTLDVYMINRSDLESTGYTMEDVATVIDSGSPPGTDRFYSVDCFSSTPFVIWEDLEGSTSEPGHLEGIAEQFGTGSEGATIHVYSDGYFRQVVFQKGGQRPDTADVRHTRVRYKLLPKDIEGEHGEKVDPATNEILYSVVNLDPEKIDRRGVIEELTQALGARRDIDNRLQDDILGSDGYYSPFGLLLGKFQYWFPKGTYFQESRN